MRSRLVLLVLALALIVAPAVPANAQDGDAPPTSEAPIEAPSIIPEPNSGHAPSEAGDRGGALQTTLFVVMCAGVVLIGAFVVRESRKARAERGF